MPALREVARKKLTHATQLGRARQLRVAQRGAQGQLTREGKTLISFTCNDYLGLSHHPRVVQAAADATLAYGTGAGASRLVTGNHPLYAKLEARLAKWKGSEAALIFGSGYLTNSSVIPALMGREDLILADKLVHACLLDGAKLSGAKLLRFAHNDMGECARLLGSHRAEHRNALLITDEVFSMDGDVAPLPELRALADAHDAWLMVDGAHALVPTSVAVDVYVGTFSKALGSYGGYVAGSKELIDLLISSARSFIFSTGLPPAVIAAADAALQLVMEDSALPTKPLAKARLFTAELGLPQAQSPIVPLILGDERKTLEASQLLEQEGFAVAAIRPPTVPEGTSRLRFTFSALQRDEDIVRLAQIIRKQGWA